MNCNTCKANKVCNHVVFGFENCNSYISEDVVEVVRCRNCVNFTEIINAKAGICYHRNSNGLRGITDFCSYGVKKEGGS